MTVLAGPNSQEPLHHNVVGRIYPSEHLARVRLQVIVSQPRYKCGRGLIGEQSEIFLEPTPPMDITPADFEFQTRYRPRPIDRSITPLTIRGRRGTPELVVQADLEFVDVLRRVRRSSGNYEGRQ